MIKNLVKLALSAGFSLLIIVLLMKLVSSGVSDAERPAILPIFWATSLGFLSFYFGVYFLNVLVRAHRYRRLISLSGEPKVPSMKSMLLVTGIRNMVVDLLPARLGELGYVGLLNRAYGVKLQHCLSSLSLTIALDFIALLLIVVAIVCVQVFSDGASVWAVGALFFALFLAVFALVGLFLILPWFVNLCSSRKPSNRFLRRSYFLIRDLNQSLQDVYRSGQAWSLIAWSLLIRVLKYLGFYLLFLAVTKNSFPELAVLPIDHVLSALIGGEVAASLPVPALMGFGVYEAGSVLVFKMLGVGEIGIVLIVMLCVHLLSQVLEYLLGGVLLLVFVWQKRPDGVSRCL